MAEKVPGKTGGGGARLVVVVCVGYGCTCCLIKVPVVDKADNEDRN